MSLNISPAPQILSPSDRQMAMWSAPSFYPNSGAHTPVPFSLSSISHLLPLLRKAPEGNFFQSLHHNPLLDQKVNLIRPDAEKNIEPTRIRYEKAQGPVKAKSGVEHRCVRTRHAEGFTVVQGAESH